MRTTITLDGDVAAAVSALRQQRGVGISEVVNDLVRTALRESAPKRSPVRLQASRVGIRVDVTDVAAALDLADGDDHA